MKQTEDKIQDILSQTYKILKLNDAEIKSSLNNISILQQLAISTELLKSFTEKEIDIVSNLKGGTDADKKTAANLIAKEHAGDQDFAGRAQDAVKKVLDNHIAYLKTRGDDQQKAEISKVLAEID